MLRGFFPRSVGLATDYASECSYSALQGLNEKGKTQHLLLLLTLTLGTEFCKTGSSPSEDLFPEGHRQTRRDLCQAVQFSIPSCVRPSNGSSKNIFQHTHTYTLRHTSTHTPTQSRPISIFSNGITPLLSRANAQKGKTWTKLNFVQFPFVRPAIKKPPGWNNTPLTPRTKFIQGKNSSSCNLNSFTERNCNQRLPSRHSRQVISTQINIPARREKNYYHIVGNH